MHPDKKKPKPEDIKDQKNPLEWGVFAVGLLMVAAIFIYLGYQTYHYKPSSPELSVEYWPEPTKAQPNRYHVLVRNTGGETAESVQVELVLRQDGQEVEKATLEMMYVPQESEREGWVNFSQKPRSKADLTGKIASYQKP